jgi:hypothetical protein
MMDLEDIEKVRADLRFRGAQGTTGTQASLYVSREHFSSYPGVSQEEFLLRHPLSRRFLLRYALETCLGSNNSKSLPEEVIANSPLTDSMEIFHGDGANIDKMNEMLAKKAGFPRCYSISTQTYTRKVDLRVANALSAFGATVQKIAGDIRHLAAQKEMEGKHILRQLFLLDCFMSCRALVTQAEGVNTMPTQQLMTHVSQLFFPIHRS